MEENKDSWLRKAEKMHPYQTMLILGMIGSGLLFLFLTYSFLITRLSQPDHLDAGNFSMPKSFIVSTLVLLVSSSLVPRINYYYRKDHTDKIKQILGATIALGILFTALQVSGWRELRMMGVDLQGLPSGSYLYVLSGIHIFHLLGAMLFALILFIQVHHSQKDEVKHLLLLANPFEKMKFRLFTVYWLFMDWIWLLLFFTFFLAF